MDDLIKRLRKYGRVEVDEHLIEYGGEWHRIEKGDRYLGQHGDNQPELLTCRRRELQRRSSGRTLGKFFPKERKDSTGNAPRLYTLEEVIKVVIRDNPNYDPTKKKEVAHEQPEPDTTPDSTDGGTPDAGRSERDGATQGASEAGVGDTGPVPAPVPKPAAPKPAAPKRGADNFDPRKPAGRTDYTTAARKPD